MSAQRLWKVVAQIGKVVSLTGVLLWPEHGAGQDVASSASLRVTWEASTEPDLAGYRLYYGTSSHDYLWLLDVGKVTSVTVPDLARGMRYYFAVSAYDSSGNESLFSAEVSGVAGVDCGTVADLTPQEYVVAALGVGDQYYIDRGYQITYIPDAYEGLLWIKTKNDDKFDMQLQISFSLLRRARLYIVHDSRVTPPSWLTTNFVQTASRIEVSDAGNSDFRIWEGTRDYEPGETVVLGCNGSAGGAASMYVVLLCVQSDASELQPHMSLSGVDVVVSWNVLPDAQYYRVYRGDTPYFEPQTPLVELGTAEFVDKGAAAEGAGARYYVVEAVRAQQHPPLRRRVGIFPLSLHTGRTLVSLPLLPASGDIATVLGQSLTGGSNALTADRIMKWTGSGYKIAWLVGGTGTAYDGKWLNENGTALSDMTLEVGEGFWVDIRTGHQTTCLYLLGEVPADSERVLTVNPGLNLVGCSYPVSISLTATGLWEQGVLTGATNSRDADRVMAWEGDHYEVAWLVDGTGTQWDGKWLNAAGSDTTHLRLEPGKGYWLHRRNGNEPRAWRCPHPFPGS